MNVLALSAGSSVHPIRTGTINYSSQGRRDWWRTGSTGVRSQQTAVSIGTSNGVMPAVLAVLRHVHADGNTDNNFVGSVLDSTFAGQSFGHRATVQNESRVARLAFSYLAAPQTSSSGYLVQTGQGTLEAVGAGSVTFETTFGATPTVVIFVRGWSFTNASGATGPAFVLTSATVTTSGFAPTLASTASAVLDRVDYSWIAIGVAA